MIAGIFEVMRIRALWPLLPITAVSYAVVLARARPVGRSLFHGGP